MVNKKHIYFVPGLAASPKIFEFISLPNKKYEFHFLKWIIPESVDESLENYVKRFSQSIKHENPILIGVSFGGFIVQEMVKYINPDKIILISSIKSENEIPKRLKFLQITKAYKLFPTRRIANIDDFSKYGFNEASKKKIKLYNKYLAVRNEKYLDWAIYNVLHWKPTNNNQNIIHIHGSEDGIFPLKHIKNSIIIEGGTHAMIITKAKKINTILEEII